MFTGIVEALGEVCEVQAYGGDRRLALTAPPGFLAHTAVGDSIACAGVCLTVIERFGDSFSVDVSAETLELTTAGRWTEGTAVNLEKALTPSKPLGGHMVSGHVDGIGRLLAAREDARSWRLEFELPLALARYVARKGSVTIDGVSLTVNDVEGPRFGVNIIPHTRSQTTLGGLVDGAAVNIEVDLIARYLERLMAGSNEA